MVVISVSLMIYPPHSKSFWATLGVTVLLSIFGSAIKNYRAIFLQVKETPYIEAARTYGASDWRIVFRLLDPAHHFSAGPAVGYLALERIFAPRPKKI